MKVLILAAGCGTRLCSPFPKTFSRVGGSTIFGRTLDNLSKMGIDLRDVWFVTGFREELFLKEGLQCIHNPLWRFPGTFSSFFIACDFTEELLVVHGDLVWEKDLLHNLLNCQGDILVPVDPGSRLKGEAMKAEVRDGRVLHLSKNLPISRSTGESMGVFLIRKPGRLKDVSKHLLWKPHASLDDGINCAAGEMSVNALLTSGKKWVEIDTPFDLKKAEVLFQ